jgi:hypothetical protein
VVELGRRPLVPGGGGVEWGGFRRGGDESAVLAQSLRLGWGEEGARERERRREGGGETRPWPEAEDWGRPEVGDDPDRWVSSVND